ncbi:hypothetical protein N656DRAFT_773593 [Canariomyces notabilis]|uniref:Uncharacterized protein n=1 Tax=Canariomyces notabilis TaxID=2074819 RepID=A0AAN6TN16_9PEZI|nr:hypothetical protein N656DRAFT_773593 [Canariomyces arenarius]
MTTSTLEADGPSAFEHAPAVSRTQWWCSLDGGWYSTEHSKDKPQAPKVTRFLVKDSFGRKGGS